MSSSTNSIGKLGESLASTHLIERGYKILERNWRFERKEVDIIAEFQEFIVFVEVKTRETDYFGRPEEFVSLAQQKNLIDAGNAYIIQNEIDLEARFDIVAIILQKGEVPEITHIERAFYPTL